MSRLCLKHADISPEVCTPPSGCSVCRLLRVRAALTEERDALRYALLHAEKPHAPGCQEQLCDCGYQLAIDGGHP